jgi:hypothetical protein
MTPPATTRRPARVHASTARTLAAEPTAADKTDSGGFPAWGTLVAVLIIAGLGGTAWTLARRRAS